MRRNRTAAPAIEEMGHSDRRSFARWVASEARVELLAAAALDESWFDDLVGRRVRLERRDRQVLRAELALRAKAAGGRLAAGRFVVESQGDDLRVTMN